MDRGQCPLHVARASIVRRRRREQFEHCGRVTQCSVYGDHFRHRRRPGLVQTRKAASSSLPISHEAESPPWFWPEALLLDPWVKGYGVIAAPGPLTVQGGRRAYHTPIADATAQESRTRAFSYAAVGCRSMSDC